MYERPSVSVSLLDESTKRKSTAEIVAQRINKLKWASVQATSLIGLIAIGSRAKVDYSSGDIRSYLLCGSLESRFISSNKTAFSQRCNSLPHRPLADSIMLRSLTMTSIKGALPNQNNARTFWKDLFPTMATVFVVLIEDATRGARLPDGRCIVFVPPRSFVASDVARQ
ncbi:hypothetical protein EVAR_16631_1 [Eumeta japonica]|uniref:Uncharacterized protein n=1 Tax=Eumeta variegata TaxID=151549 RepID=A0A4C1V0S7_EUMVA|nr:hypothetical protein EVAR_16631_1 [Eumeta japonica]